MSQEIKKYDFIDALRGYAILLVILVHSADLFYPGSNLKHVMTWGAHGVQLFYIASALTLCMSWHYRALIETAPIRNFFIRRFFRIAPMFYLAIIFYTCMYGFEPRYWAPNGVQWWYLPLTAMFLNGYHPEVVNSVVPGGWSIAVEMNFYLALPFLMRFIKNKKHAVIFVVLSFGIERFSKLLFEHFFMGHYSPDQQYLVSDFTSLNFFGQLPVFAFGILTYYLYLEKESLKRFLPYVCLGLMAFLILATFKLPTTLIEKLVNHHLFAGALFALLSLTLASYPNAFFVNKLITSIGKVSFSMYLSHFAVLEALKTMGINTYLTESMIGSLVGYGVVVTLSFVISAVLYGTIELYGIKYAKVLIDKLDNRQLKVLK